MYEFFDLFLHDIEVFVATLIGVFFLIVFMVTTVAININENN